MTFKLYRL